MNSKAVFVVLAVLMFSLGLSSVSAYAQTGSTNSQTVNEQTLITLSGEQSTDPQNQNVSYTWEQMSGPQVTLSSTTTQDISFTTPAVAAGQTVDLQFALTVVNPQGLSSITSFTLHVIHVNHPPVVTTDHDLTVMEGNPVTLMATATDADGDPMTYAWTQDAGPMVTLTNPTELTTMFTAPAVGSSGNETLHLTISANDGNGGIGTDSVTVHVISAAAYKIATLTCGPIIRSHAGGSTSLPVTVDNPSDSPITYQWAQISGSPIQISSTTDPAPTVTLPTGSGGSVYDFQLTINQGGSPVGTCEQYVYAAYPEPGAAPQADAGPDQVVNTGSQVTLDGTKSIGAYLTYSWSQISGDPVQLLDANTAHPEFTAPSVPLGGSENLVFTNVVKNPFGKDGAMVTITVVHPALPPTAVITLK
ncbi:MAG: hypothetical protein WA833_03715 [Nitrosotalea sp.]